MNGAALRCAWCICTNKSQILASPVSLRVPAGRLQRLSRGATRGDAMLGESGGVRRIPVQQDRGQEERGSSQGHPQELPGSSSPRSTEVRTLE